ncbi:MAG: metallophosphoesterase [Clostridia bacterium]
MSKAWLCRSGTLPSVVPMRVHARARGLAGKKLLFLTDLHYGRWMGDDKFSRVIDLANAQSPDVIVLGGDLAENERDEARLCARHLKNLRAPLGIYCVPGNNDYEAFGGQYDRFRAMLYASGVRLLLNERFTIPVEGGALVISGLDESKYGHPDQAVLDFAQGPGDFHLLATHSPWALDEVLGRAKVDLALCGHTHGGQVALGPLTALAMGYDLRALSSRKYFFMQGDHTVDGVRVVVSRGIGCSLLPVRIGAPPQMHLVTFDIFPAGKF